MSIRITGMNSGMDTDAMIKDLVSTYDKQGQKYKKAKTKTEWKKEAFESLNSKVKTFFNKNVSTMRFSDAYRKKATTVSDSTKASIVASDNAVNGTQSLEIKELAKAGYLTGASLKDQGVTGSTKIVDLLGSDKQFAGDQTVKISCAGKNYDVTVNENTTVANFVSALKEIDGLSANFDESNGRFFINSNESGVSNDFNFDGNTGNAANILAALGITGEGSYKDAGQDAEIKLNGATFTSSSNSFSINGLTITAKEKTTSAMSITTDTDVEGIYNSIKSFITEYGKLINELDKLYNADSAKKYEPLTDEEKEAMTDDEIEKWETKIKDSLLRRDSDVDAIASAMRNSMLQAFTIGADENGEGGKVYSLSSFGIETLGYFEAEDNEKNAYHIAGDSDDKYSSAGTDKLKAMIASNLSDVEGFFTQLVGGLYNNLNKISSETNNYTSYGSFYNDKKVKSELTDQESQIAKWEKYVADIEDKYYKQFTAMETALGKMNSQQSYLSQLFA